MAKSICEICGTERVKLTGSSLFVGCPKGHGKLHLPPEPDPPKPRGRPKETLPVAILHDSSTSPMRYVIAGLEGFCQRYRTWTGGPWLQKRQRETPGVIVRARLDGKPTKFVKIEENK
jgi:hypothetical protein